MTQAARSGRQNIIEGSERSSTSMDTEMKLTDVARASLSELRGDYEMFILDRGQLPWSVHSPGARAINAISLDDAPFADDMVHESAKHALEQRKKYARWLDDDDAVVVANAMLIIIGRALNMLKSQIEAQGKSFEETGGFGERLMARRIESRAKQQTADAPRMPAMRQADAPAHVGQRRFLGVLCLPGLQRHETGMKKIGEKGDLVDRADRIVSEVNKVNRVNITGYTMKDLGGDPEEIHKAFTGFQHPLGKEAILRVRDLNWRHAGFEPLSDFGDIHCYLFVWRRYSPLFGGISEPHFNP